MFLELDLQEITSISGYDRKHMAFYTYQCFLPHVQLQGYVIGYISKRSERHVYSLLCTRPLRNYWEATSIFS